MSIRQDIFDYSKGDRLRLFWRLFAWRSRVSSRLLQDILSVFLNRMAHKHGGYIGRDTVFRGKPILPHGLHGIFISRYASIGTDCRIYQNVTIGEVGQKAPRIGDHCLIGAGAVLIGNITVGSDVKIGAGATVCTDIPDGATVIAQPSRILIRGTEHDGIWSRTRLD